MAASSLGLVPYHRRSPTALVGTRPHVHGGGGRAGPTGPGVSLPEEAPQVAWQRGSLRIELLPSRDLGNSSFVVEDRDRRAAAVIDPTRDTTRYVDRLRRANLRLAWVLDTHLHADFVSGGRELAEREGATFGIDAGAEATFGHRRLRNGETLDVGAGRLSVLRTPGHSPEHISFLLADERGRDVVLFSGGSLMAGSAGRADLLGPERTYGLAREQFVTLHERYAALPGAVAVLPTHAGGTFCGVGGRDASTTTLGRERRTNPLLRAPDLATFLAAYLVPTPFPSYYGLSRTLNRDGGIPGGSEPPSSPALGPADVESLRAGSGVTVLDVRSSEAFDRAHLPGSLSVPGDGPVSAWVGWLRPRGEAFVLVADSVEDRRRVELALFRIGFDGVRGYLDGGTDAYARAGFPLVSTPRASIREVRGALEKGEPIVVLDVRDPSETAESRVPGSLNVPLPQLARGAAARLPPNVPIYVHCEHGYRSGIASSVLEQAGFLQIRHVTDGPGGFARSSAGRSPARRRGGSRRPT